MASAESGGPVEQINYFPQAPSQNQPPGTWRRMELFLQNLKQSNPQNTYRLEITPKFENNSKRLYRFEVDIFENGTPLEIRDEFTNILNP